MKAARKSKNADAEEENGAAEMADEAPAAAAPKLKGKAAKLAAALASSASAPIHRCDADSLSLVFSFLSTREFLASIAVSRSFRAARMKHTAWPTLNLESFIQSLRDDNYSDGARRRLNMELSQGSAHQLRLGSLALGRALEQVETEDARILKIRSDHKSVLAKATKAGGPLPQLPADLTNLLTTAAAPGTAGVRDFEVGLLQLSVLPYVSAINISGGRTYPEGHSNETTDAPSPEVVRKMYERLAQANACKRCCSSCAVGLCWRD